MNYVLKNEFLTVTVADKGAEIRSVRGCDGTEFMWQADAAYWGRTAPWMLPICGRLQGGAYTYEGVAYKMSNHGFARDMVFTLVSSLADTLTFTLSANEETKKIYPFDFSFSVTYRLAGNALSCTLTATNEGTRVMPATFGGHPAFCVPVGGVGTYEDCYLEFSAPCTPRQVVYGKTLLDTGVRVPYQPEDGVRISLTREMFADDSIFLSDVAESVTLRSRKTAHAVEVSYGKVPYLGIWSTYPAGDFVCIEPWYGMASPEGVSAFEEKPHLFWIAPGACQSAQMSYTFY